MLSNFLLNTCRPGLYKPLSEKVLLEVGINVLRRDWVPITKREIFINFPPGLRDHQGSRARENGRNRMGTCSVKCCLLDRAWPLRGGHNHNTCSYPHRIQSAETPTWMVSWFGFCCCDKHCPNVMWGWIKWLTFIISAYSL